jgi:O-antigen ligase
MNRKIHFIYKNTEILEKIVIGLIILIPFALCMSILIADLFASLIGLITIYWIFLKKKNLDSFKIIKKPLAVIFLFYLFIIISLIFSNDLGKSFLPSFFYFRYIFMAIGIFYIFNKFEYSLHILLFSFFFLISLIIIYAFYEYLKIHQYFGLSLSEFRINTGMGYYITGFFNEEKKLGSFLLRFLPLILSLVIFLDLRIFKKYKLEVVLLTVFGILIIMTSERTSLFLFLLFTILSLKVVNFKFYALSIPLILSIIVLASQPQLINKYFVATLYQLEIVESPTDSLSIDFNKLNFSNMRYLSDEHEKLFKSGLEVFKENPLTGSGIKTYHDTCNNIKSNKLLEIECSTHPHNTYIQILSDIGIFGMLIIVFIFFYILYLNLKIFFKDNLSILLKSFYILNLGILVNIMPLVPAGSFFNNWINLMIYFPIGFWFYLFFKINNEKLNN